MRLIRSVVGVFSDMGEGLRPHAFYHIEGAPVPFLDRQHGFTHYPTHFQKNQTICHLCPLDCRLNPGETCFCRTRQNVDGRLMCHAYNNPCTLTVDPIEKLPLTHWLPGTQTLSLAVGGCNLRCLYCQNWRESQSKPMEIRTYEVTPEDAHRGAENRQVRTIAYTYTEPVVFYEYARDVATYAREHRMRNVCATALFIRREPLRRLCRVMDAFAVALKGFSEQFYDRVLGSRLAPVLEALETLAEEEVHTEIVTLIVPTYNDDFGQIGEMCRWIVSRMGANTPLHFGRFVPEYRLRDLPRTPVPTLERCRQIGLEAGLKHVYVFNVSPHEGNHTYCGECGRLVIERLGFRILRNDAPNGRCGNCHWAIPGVWTEARR